MPPVAVAAGAPAEDNIAHSQNTRPEPVTFAMINVSKPAKGADEELEQDRNFSCLADGITRNLYMDSVKAVYPVYRKITGSTEVNRLEIFEELAADTRKASVDQEKRQELLSFLHSDEIYPEMVIASRSTFGKGGTEALILIGRTSIIDEILTIYCIQDTIKETSSTF